MTEPVGFELPLGGEQCCWMDGSLKSQLSVMLGAIKPEKLITTIMTVLIFPTAFSEVVTGGTSMRREALAVQQVRGPTGPLAFIDLTF